MLIVLVDVVTWIVERYRWQGSSSNRRHAPAALLAGAVVGRAGSRPGHVPVRRSSLAAVGTVSMALNVVITPTLSPCSTVARAGAGCCALRALMVPAVLLNVGLASAASRTSTPGSALIALAFVLLNVVAFTYMTRLVVTARERTREYAGLSWGVLSGLHPDARRARLARRAPLRRRRRVLARHRAGSVGMSKRDRSSPTPRGCCTTSGKFALSDRVMERGGELEESDWRGIRRHPDIGAELLRDIGVYGPVAEIVRAHHERIDGRGYPRGLHGDEIPEIARIVAVAEVYDTLTAPDTYRTPMNSFEALNELRRVAGSQLDRASTSRRSPTCCRAAAPTTATPTRPTSTASSTSSGG